MEHADRRAAIEAAIGGAAAPVVIAAPEVLDEAARAASVVLVEGISDRLALLTLAARRGRDLAAERVAVLPTGGATSMGRLLRALGPTGARLPVTGLCDVAEAGHVRRALASVGHDGADPGAHGFFFCVDDLEDELIRALGPDAVEGIVAAAGDLDALSALRKQPAQRDRPDPLRLRRFLGTKSGRKERYAPLLVAALPLDRVPAPLDAVLRATGGRP